MHIVTISANLRASPASLGAWREIARQSIARSPADVASRCSYPNWNMQANLRGENAVRPLPIEGVIESEGLNAEQEEYCGI